MKGRTQLVFMKGKTVVITGGTSGIGEVAALELAQMGARIVLVGRDKPRAQTTLARLRERGPGLAHTVHYADLTRLAEMKRVAAQIAGAEPRIDVLINNAGAMFAARRVTEDGLERTFALNHMAYFVVTAGLRERLTASAGARIVNTASDAHRGAMLDFDNLQSEKGFGAMQAYGRSKLCNILFTRELARRLHGTGVTANCLHPGFVATRFGDQSGGLISHMVWLAKYFAIPPTEGAKTVVYLAASPEADGVSGKYFYKCRATTPSPAAEDDHAASALWERSVELAGVKA
jgi:NAD(P)-dependent dehydrogenase (short-subunit alcohol dehydrogenase family)